MSLPHMSNSFGGRRSPAPSTGGSESDLLNFDPYYFKNKWEEERSKRKMLEMAALRDSVSKATFGLSSDALEKTLDKSFAKLASTLVPPRSASKMPLAGSASAPETFTGASARLLPDFFKRFEACLDESNITKDTEKLNHLLKYVSAKVRDWIEGTESYQMDDYQGTKDELLELYNNPEQKDVYKERDLEVLSRESAKTEITHQDQLSERLMVFNTMARRLYDAQKITEETKNKLYLMSFTEERRKALKAYLVIKYPDHPRDKAHSVANVYKAAKYLLVPEIDEEVVGDPRTHSQRNQEEAKRQKASDPSARSTNEPGDGLYDLVAKMNKLNISDPVYENYYAYMCRVFPDATHWVRRPARFCHSLHNTVNNTSQDATSIANVYGTSTYASNNAVTVGARPEWPRPKCFYCAKEGCQTRICPRVAEDEGLGLIRREGMYIVYHTGERLLRRDGGFQQDVKEKRARELADKATKQIQPHQANAYILDESNDEYCGLYIGVQEVEPTEEVNAIAASLEEEWIVAMAEGYYDELMADGVGEDEAIEKAWVMAQLRATTTRAREARESSKPYDREKGKGRSKAVHFEDKEAAPEAAMKQGPSASKGSIKFQPDVPVTPNPRFPPAAPMPARPLQVQKPNPESWPRPPLVPQVQQQTVSPISTRPVKSMPGTTFATPLTPSSFNAQRKPPIVPEIDMTMKEPGAKYRFTSDVEEKVDIETTLDKLLGQIKVEVSFVDLMALSPVLRKRISEQTKTKRVPTDISKASQKSMVYVEGEEPLYISMPIVEAVERTPKYSGALPKIQAEIGGVLATGMLDSGSQINLMTEEFWSKTGLPINEGKKIRMQGVNLMGEQSIGLCEYVEVPFAGVSTVAHFHVFKKAPYSFIVGQPWIQDHLILSTETGTSHKILIRDFRDPKNRVTMILRNDPLNSARGDLPTVVETGMPPVQEVSAFYGIMQDSLVDPSIFDKVEKGMAEEDQTNVVTIDGLTGEYPSNYASQEDVESSHKTKESFGRRL
jgi:hypothetical protein